MYIALSMNMQTSDNIPSGSHREIYMANNDSTAWIQRPINTTNSITQRQWRNATTFTRDHVDRHRQMYSCDLLPFPLPTTTSADPATTINYEQHHRRRYNARYSILQSVISTPFIVHTASRLGSTSVPTPPSQLSTNLHSLSLSVIILFCAD